MDNNALFVKDRDTVTVPQRHKSGVKGWAFALLAFALVAGVIVLGPGILAPNPGPGAAPPPPSVVVSEPLRRDVDSRLEFLGQFSAVQSVELRPQVGGALTEIGFKDGDIVQKGDLLFLIDPTPYQIKLNEATAALEAARARLALANRQLKRFTTLSQSGAGTIEATDQAVAEQLAAEAAVDGAQAQIRDAQFDLDHTRIVAPFTGKIGTHEVSVGNLISGSRAGTSPTTLLATMVSTGPIYFNFDMSETDYQTFLKYRRDNKAALAENVKLSLNDDTHFTRQGVLDFIDNTLDRASGTIHARATVPDDDLSLTPGSFARARVEVGPPAPAFLLPDSAVLSDQTQHNVLVVGPNDIVTPKLVQIGEIRGGLRVITAGLAPTDKVIIDGVPVAHPGTKVSPHDGSIHVVSDQTQG